MRTKLSPLMRQIADHILATVPNTSITENVDMDSFGVHIGTRAIDHRAFVVEPSGKPSYERDAAWPVHVMPVPPPTPSSWDCRSLEDVIATLQWPDMIPNVPTITVEEARKRNAQS